MKQFARIWVVSEVYYPDEQGGGHFMTKLAEGLASCHDVHVICGYPYYRPGLKKPPASEVRNGVHIRRCYSTSFSKKHLVLRMFNFLTISLSLFVNALLRIGRDDLVIVVTTPPTLPFFVVTACRIVGAKCVLRIEDMYPGTLVATGVAKPAGTLVKVFSRINRYVHGNADHITVIGRDMQSMLTETAENALEEDRVTMIPNWGELDLIKPQVKSENRLLGELGLTDRFVVLCAGNMGRAQAVENIVYAAELLKKEGTIHFLFIGEGVKKDWMKEFARSRELNNVTILDQRPRSDQANFLNSCDVAIVSLISGMKGFAVPSRLYNIMAAGKPVIAMTAPDSEVSLVITEENIGWVTPPDDPQGLADTVLEAFRRGASLESLGSRARAVVEKRYTYEQGIQKYCDVIENVAGSVNERFHLKDRTGQ